MFSIKLFFLSTGILCHVELIIEKGLVCIDQRMKFLMKIKLPKRLKNEKIVSGYLAITIDLFESLGDEIHNINDEEYGDIYENIIKF